jgi:hypothetical protein
MIIYVLNYICIIYSVYNEDICGNHISSENTSRTLAYFARATHRCFFSRLAKFNGRSAQQIAQLPTAAVA